MRGKNMSPSTILTPGQIETMAKLRAKWADEQARLEGKQHNERVELLERQRAEAEVAAASGEKDPEIGPGEAA
jgi:hypothetical protein